MAYPIDNLSPIHPGHFLRDELDVLGLSARKFAEHIGMPHNAVTGIMNGERSISAQMAIRLSQAFDTTPQYWLNLQRPVACGIGETREASSVVKEVLQ